MTAEKCEIGMVGLGVMGRNLALNMADKGYPVAGYDTDYGKIEALNREGEGRPVRGAGSLEEMTQMLRSPRAVIVLVPAGRAVDAVINDILPHLHAGDVLMDGGNSHFKDTDGRAQALAEKGILYMGVGISGGEYGARHGPSLMPGGPEEAYERVQPVFEAIAARTDGEACVAYLGPRSAGHYVKMVHNGIEYAMIQLIAESYDLLKRGMDLPNEELHEIYRGWSVSALRSYLMEITADIFQKKDDVTSGFLVDMILDEAQEKGTGKWTAQDAMDLRVPVPTIDVAVAMRDLSNLKEERLESGKLPTGPDIHLHEDSEGFVSSLQNALVTCMIVTYAQGLAQLSQASRAYGYGLNLEAVARIWRGGCIIRSDMLGPMRDAFQNAPELQNLLLDPVLRQFALSGQTDLRDVVCTATQHGLPVPAIGTCLAYLDAYRSVRLPANLIQALRDYFGAHGYRRLDREGSFHTEWK